VIPWQDSEKLYALAREPKQKIFIPDGDHIDAFSGRYANLYRDIDGVAADNLHRQIGVIIF
ncbi:hypothetical protein MJN54_30025, partial [Salmonella enterica subsp. enterica serovar Kentucky]|nr:hypothetical protein [Salmonella enterica subsp. enterica serovar Kentucky]